MIRMTIPEDKKLTVNEFFEAVSDSEERYELVEGVVRLTARANERHNVIRSNVLAAFVPAGKQRGCRATSVNTGVQTGPDTIRYPDVVVDCGPRNAQALTASKPTIVVEVFAPETAVFDHSAKLREYRTVESIGMVIQIESEMVLVKVHRRQQDGTWTEETVEKTDVGIHLPPIATSITINEIYDALDVRSQPRVQVGKIERTDGPA
jgi:Uma2 family endonuclease